jgi:hypothetical protein
MPLIGKKAEHKGAKTTLTKRQFGHQLPDDASFSTGRCRIYKDYCGLCHKMTYVNTDGSGIVSLYNRDGSLHGCEEPPAIQPTYSVEDVRGRLWERLRQMVGTV